MNRRSRGCYGSDVFTLYKDLFVMRNKDRLLLCPSSVSADSPANCHSAAAPADAAAASAQPAEARPSVCSPRQPHRSSRYVVAQS